MFPNWDHFDDIETPTHVATCKTHMPAQKKKQHDMHATTDMTHMSPLARHDTLATTGQANMSKSQLTRQKKKHRVFMAGQRSHDDQFRCAFERLQQQFDDIHDDMKIQLAAQQRQFEDIIKFMHDFADCHSALPGVSAVTASMHVPDLSVSTCYSRQTLLSARPLSSRSPVQQYTCHINTCSSGHHDIDLPHNLSQVKKSMAHHLPMQEFLEMANQVKINIPHLPDRTPGDIHIDTPLQLVLAIWSPAAHEPEGTQALNEHGYTEAQCHRATVTDMLLHDIHAAVEHGYDWTQLTTLPHMVIKTETIAKSRTIVETEHFQHWSRQAYPYLCAMAYGLAEQHHKAILTHVVMDNLDSVPEYVYTDILNELQQGHSSVNTVD